MSRPSATAYGATGVPSVSLTSTQTGSVVVGSGNDWDTATVRTLGTGQTLLHEYTDTSYGDDFWVQQVTAPTGAVGSTITVNDTAPAGDRWNLAAVEIVPTPSSTTTVTRYTYAGSGGGAWGTLDGNNTLTQHTVNLPGGATMLIASATTWTYPNLHGDEIVTAGNTGTRATGHSSYDPFGQPIDPTTGAIGTTSSDDKVPDTSGGKQADTAWAGGAQKVYEHVGDIATIEMGARQYVPALGRFLCVDPIPGGNSNSYNYPNDPVNYWDPSGMAYIGSLRETASGEFVTPAQLTEQVAIARTIAAVRSGAVTGKPYKNLPVRGEARLPTVNAAGEPLEWQQVRLIGAASGSPDRLAYTAKMDTFYLTDQHNFRFFRLSGEGPVAIFGSSPRPVLGSSPSVVDVDPAPMVGISGGGADPNLRE